MNNFKKNLIAGTTKESIFIDDFLNFLYVPYIDTRNNPNYRKIGVDFVLYGNIKAEVKSTSSKDYIYIQEYKIMADNKRKLGWFYTSKCDLFIFVNTNREIIILKNDNNFKMYYESVIKKNHPLKQIGNLLLREVKKTALGGFASIYKKVF